VSRALGQGGLPVFLKSVSVTIPADAEVEGGKTYVDPETYARLEGGSHWTLDERSGKDFIVYGECQAEITESYGAENLKKDFPRHCVVKAASDNTNASVLRHWKVSGV
jgi:hypothetical protein